MDGGSSIFCIHLYNLRPTSLRQSKRWKGQWSWPPPDRLFPKVIDARHKVDARSPLINSTVEPQTDSNPKLKQWPECRTHQGNKRNISHGVNCSEKTNTLLSIDENNFATRSRIIRSSYAKNVIITLRDFLSLQLHDVVCLVSFANINDENLKQEWPESAVLREMSVQR